jgi:hypothetical protein
VNSLEQFENKAKIALEIKALEGEVKKFSSVLPNGVGIEDLKNKKQEQW